MGEVEAERGREEWRERWTLENCCRHAIRRPGIMESVLRGYERYDSV